MLTAEPQHCPILFLAQVSLLYRAAFQNVLTCGYPPYHNCSQYFSYHFLLQLQTQHFHSRLCLARPRPCVRRPLERFRLADDDEAVFRRAFTRSDNGETVAQVESDWATLRSLETLTIFLGWKVANVTMIESNMRWIYRSYFATCRRNSRKLCASSDNCDDNSLERD